VVLWERGVKSAIPIVVFISENMLNLKQLYRLDAGEPPDIDDDPIEDTSPPGPSYPRTFTTCCTRPRV
jgi:hypothetical protein